MNQSVGYSWTALRRLLSSVYPTFLVSVTIRSLVQGGGLSGYRRGYIIVIAHGQSQLIIRITRLAGARVTPSQANFEYVVWCYGLVQIVTPEKESSQS